MVNNVLACLGVLLVIINGLFLIIILLFTDSPQAAHIITLQRIDWCLIISSLLTVIGLILHFISYKSGIAVQITTATYALSIGLAVAGIYNFLNMEKTSERLVKEKCETIINSAKNHTNSNGPINSQLMGSLLPSIYRFTTDEDKKIISDLLIKNADFVFDQDFIGGGVFDKPKKLYSKGTHIVTILLGSRQYEFLKEMAPYIKNVNYINPTSSAFSKKTIFEEVVNEYRQYEYVDAADAIKVMIQNGGKVITMDSSGKTVLDLLVAEQIRSASIAQGSNPQMTEARKAEYGQRAKQISEIIDLISKSQRL